MKLYIFYPTVSYNDYKAFIILCPLVSHETYVENMFFLQSVNMYLYTNKNPFIIQIFFIKKHHSLICMCVKLKIHGAKSSFFM